MTHGHDEANLPAELLHAKTIAPPSGGLAYMTLLGVAVFEKRKELAYGAALERWYFDQTGDELATGHIYSAAGALVKQGLISAKSQKNPSGHGKPITVYHLTDVGKAGLHYLKLLITEKRKHLGSNGASAAAAGATSGQSGSRGASRQRPTTRRGTEKYQPQSKHGAQSHAGPEASATTSTRHRKTLADVGA